MKGFSEYFSDLQKMLLSGKAAKEHFLLLVQQDVADLWLLSGQSITDEIDLLTDVGILQVHSKMQQMQQFPQLKRAVLQ